MPSSSSRRFSPKHPVHLIRHQVAERVSDGLGCIAGVVSRPRGQRLRVRFLGIVEPRCADRAGGFGCGGQDILQWKHSGCTAPRPACEKPCPPPSKTTDALREVVLNWLGEPDTPPRVVLSTPSKNIEAWVVAAVWPDNSLVRRPNWECRSNPEDQLAQLPKVRRFEKHEDDYKRKEKEIQNGWRNDPRD